MGLGQAQTWGWVRNTLPWPFERVKGRESRRDGSEVERGERARQTDRDLRRRKKRRTRRRRQRTEKM